MPRAYYGGVGSRRMGVSQARTKELEARTSESENRGSWFGARDYGFRKGLGFRV